MLNAATPSATFAAARFSCLPRSSYRAARYAASSSAFRLLPATTPARKTRACVVASTLIDEEEGGDDDDGSGMVCRFFFFFWLCHVPYLFENRFRVSLGNGANRHIQPPQPTATHIDPLYPEAQRATTVPRSACSFRASGIQQDRQVFFARRSALPIGATK